MQGISSGSLIEARHTVNLLPFVLIFLSIALLVAVIFFISQYIKNYKKSPEYLQKMKKRPIRYKDTLEVAKSCNLTKEETDLLWDVCNKNKTSYSFFLAKDKDEFEFLLKNEFNDLKKKKNEDKITTLFSLRKKLFLSFIPHIIIKSTKAIDGGTVFVYTEDRGVHYNLEYREKTLDALYLQLPQVLVAKQGKPGPMEKIILTFIAKDDTAYKFETRIIRYQKDRHGNDCMVCAHSDLLVPLEKRTSDRVDIDLDVQFSAVRIDSSGTGKKQKIEYIPLDRRYPGKLLDISAGGCRMVTKLPIRPAQNIYIEGTFNMNDLDHAIGTIIRTTKRRDGLIVLHIKFVEIEKAVKNRILALACKY